MLDHRFVHSCQRSVVYPTFTVKLASLNHFCYNSFVSTRQEDNYDR
jgi:hypothetical protein